MPNLLDWLGGVAAEINPFDNGDNFNSYIKKRQQPQRPQPQPQQVVPQRIAPPQQLRPLGFTSPMPSPASVSRNSVTNQFNPLKALADISRPISQGGINGLADIGNAITNMAQHPVETATAVASGIQRVPAVVGDIDLQGRAVVGSLVDNLNPALTQEQRDINNLRRVQETEIVRNWLKSLKSLDGQSMIRQDDWNPTGDFVKDTGDLIGRSADVANSATTLINPTASFVKGAAGRTFMPVLKNTARDATFFGTLNGVQQGATTLGQTGDFGKAFADGTQAAGQAALMQGAMGLGGYAAGRGLSKATSTTKKATTATAKAVNESRPSVIAAQHPEIQQLDSHINMLQQQFDNEPNKLVRNQLNKAITVANNERRSVYSRALSQAKRAQEGGYAKIPNPDELFKKNAKNAYKVSDGQKYYTELSPAESDLKMPFTNDKYNELLHNKNHTDAVNQDFNKNLGYIKTLSNPDKIIKDAQSGRVNYVRELQGSNEGKVNRVGTKPVEQKGNQYLNTSFIQGGKRRNSKLLDGLAKPSSPVGDGASIPVLKSNSNVPQSKGNVNNYTKANKELKTAIDARINETNPELFHTEATGRTLSETGASIPSIHVDDLKRYFGHTEDFPAKYKRTTGRADLDELAREAGFDDVDNYVEAIQQELGTRSKGRENAQMLRDLRNDPTIIEEARQSLADEKARYGTPDTFEPSARDLREADKMNRPQVESTSRRVERALDPNDKLAYKNLSPLEKKLYQGEKAKQRLAKTQAMKQGTAVESQTQSKVPEKGNTASPKTSRGQQKVSSPSVVRLSDKSRTPLEVRGQNSKEIRSQIKSALNNSSAKERGFIETIINDPHTAQHIKDNVTSLYNVRNTKDLQIRAKNLVKDSPDLAQRVAEAGNGDVSVAVGSELLKHLQKNGNYETALDLADKLAKQGTEAGRTAQAFSIYGKLTPSGVLRFAQRTIKQYNDANNLAPGKQLKLTPQQAKSLTDKSTALWKMPEGRAKDIATKELVGEIYKLVPSSWAAKISTGQTMAQLLNPKTAIRNVLGNTLFGGVDNISQVLASGIDKATSKVRGSARTTALPSAKAQLGGLKSGAKQAIEEINKGVNLGPNTQFELGDVPTFRGGIMGGLEKTMSYELRVPDRAAYQAAFDDTVHGLMKANKLDKPTAEILEQANANGLYKTFQDNSTAAKLFVKSKEALNHVGIEGKDGKRFGLGDLLLKYPKTPGNILARGLDYSPVGIVKGLTQIVKPAITGKPFNQHTFANSIARGTVGTGAIMGAGAVLGGLGIITEAPNEDTDARNLQKASGQGGYQINVDALRRYLFSGFDSDEAKLKEGDTLVSYDWAQPTSIPLSAGAAIGKKQNPGDAAISTVSNAANGLNTLIEQPLVSGLNTFFNNVKNKGVVGAAGETAKGAPASFVPTASNQTRQLTDNTTRSTYDPRLYGLVQSLNMVANKIPGASYLLHPQVDTLGNDKQNYQNGSNNLLNVAFNPAFVNKYQPDSAAKLPLGIMNDTGETKQIPTTTKTTQKVNGENMQLTAQQNEDFQRYVGLKTRDYLETASKDKQFMSLNQQDQATRISQAISNIQQAARVQVLGGNSDNADKNVKNILTTGAATLNTKAVSSGGLQCR